MVNTQTRGGQTMPQVAPFGSGDIAVAWMDFNGTTTSRINVRLLYSVESGTDAADTIAGGSERDFIIGLGGDDQLRGGDQNDTVDGGSGNDMLSGGAGDDVLDGGDGDDRLEGGAGFDVLEGGAGIARSITRSKPAAATSSSTCRRVRSSVRPASSSARCRRATRSAISTP